MTSCSPCARRSSVDSFIRVSQIQAAGGAVDEREANAFLLQIRHFLSFSSLSSSFGSVCSPATVTMATLNDIVPSGVITGDHVLRLFEHARANGYAIPAVNCTR